MSVSTSLCSRLFSVFIMATSLLSGESPVAPSMGGLSLILLLLVKVKPTNGRWTVKAVILFGGMGSVWGKRGRREREGERVWGEKERERKRENPVKYLFSPNPLYCSSSWKSIIIPLSASYPPTPPYFFSPFLTWWCLVIESSSSMGSKLLVSVGLANSGMYGGFSDLTSSQSMPLKNGWLLKSSMPLRPRRTLGSQINLEREWERGGKRERERESPSPLYTILCTCKVHKNLTIAWVNLSIDSREWLILIHISTLVLSSLEWH